MPRSRSRRPEAQRRTLVRILNERLRSEGVPYVLVGQYVVEPIITVGILLVLIGSKIGILGLITLAMLFVFYKLVRLRLKIFRRSQTSSRSRSRGRQRPR